MDRVALVASVAIESGSGSLSGTGWHGVSCVVLIMAFMTISDVRS